MMVLPAVSLVQGFHESLVESGFKDMRSFEALGVDPRDVSAQSQLADVLTQIAEGVIIPKYIPEMQQVIFYDAMSDPQAVFKPGGTRAFDETFTRRFFYQLDAPESAVASMISTFDFSKLAPIKAEAFNPDAFEVGDWSETELVDENSGSEEDGVEFTSSHDAGIIYAQISDFPFAQAELRSHRRAFFLPHTEVKGEMVKADDMLHLEGSLIGVLEPWIDGEKALKIDFVKTILVAAILGMRDLKMDALNGGTIFDAEEIMAAEDRASPFPKSSLHIPALSDRRAMQKLNSVEIKIIKTMVESWKIKDLVRYARDQRMLYRLKEIESLELSEDPEEPIIHRLDAFGITCFLEESGREEELFPPIRLGQDNLFAEAQVSALEKRLKALQEAFAGIDVYAEGDCPVVTLWGLVNVIDPMYERAVTEIKEARGRMLSGRNSGLSAADVRLFQVDAGEANFVEALTSNVGRVSLRSQRARTSSVPDSMLHQSEVDDPPPIVRSASVAPDYLARFKFTPISQIDASEHAPDATL